MTKNQRDRRAKKDTMMLTVWPWPRKLQNRMKVAAIRRGMSFKDALQEACEQWLRRKK